MTVDLRADAFKHLFEPACCGAAPDGWQPGDAPIESMFDGRQLEVLPSYVCSIEHVFEAAVPRGLRFLAHLRIGVAQNCRRGPISLITATTTYA